MIVERWQWRPRPGCGNYPARHRAIGEGRFSKYMVRVVRHVQEESEDLSAGELLVIVATVEGVGAMVMVEREGKWEVALDGRCGKIETSM